MAVVYNGEFVVKVRCSLLLIVLAMVCTGCYPGITGKVVDAETGDPIEDAVIMVEWTRTKGIGLEHTESYKVVETVTNKKGEAKISGVYNPLVDAPDVTVYKKGFVAWSSRIVFPDRNNREDFQWRDGYVFKMEHFKQQYSYDNHSSFINSAIGSGRGDKKKIRDAYRWEREKALEERKKSWNK